MEKQKIYLNKKTGNYGNYYSAKIKIEGKEYYLNVYEGLKSDQFGEYMSCQIKEATPKQENESDSFKDDSVPF